MYHFPRFTTVLPSFSHHFHNFSLFFICFHSFKKIFFIVVFFLIFLFSPFFYSFLQLFKVIHSLCFNVFDSFSFPSNFSEDFHRFSQPSPLKINSFSLFFTEVPLSPHDERFSTQNFLYPPFFHPYSPDSTLPCPCYLFFCFPLYGKWDHMDFQT